MSSNQELDRRQFVEQLAFFFAATVGIGSILTACGKTSSSYSSGNQPQTQSGGNCLVNGPAISIQVIHTPNHTLAIPTGDIVAGTQQTYILADNGAGHTHQVTLSAADFASLQKNNGIVEVSTTTESHAHSVVVNCA